MLNNGTGDFCGETDEHVYRIFTSLNNDDTFEELCVVPLHYSECYGRELCVNVKHVWLTVESKKMS